MTSTFAGQLTAAVNMLDYLGDSIAQYLADEGFQGERGSALVDPVANYLVDRIPDAVAARTDIELIEVINAAGEVVDVYTPVNVADFMERFDADAHPELDINNHHNHRAA